MNHLTVYGRLGRDAELKEINGSKVMELNICQCQKKSEEGQAPIWWHASFWGDKYANIEPYLKKGSAVIVFGEMAFPHTYQNKAQGWTTSLKIKGIDIKFNPFGPCVTLGSNEQQKKSEEKTVVYPGTFQSKTKETKEQSHDDLGELF